MLICNKRRKCEKASSCQHAVKHIETIQCHFKLDCPHNNIENHSKCIPYGRKIGKVILKARESANKVIEPITQQEAQKALVDLKKLIHVEKRLSGETEDFKLSFTHDAFCKTIQGLSNSYIVTLFPDYRKRGLNRHQIISSLYKEKQRQMMLHTKRLNQAPPKFVYKDRDSMLQEKREKRVNEALRNYSLSHRICFSYLSFSSKNKIVITKLSRNKLQFSLRFKKGMVIDCFQKHLILYDYEDKGKKEFPCFALVGSSTDFELVPTLIENGDFVDPFFKDGRSKEKYKKEKL